MSVLDAQEKMVMIRDEYKRMDLNRAVLLRSSEDPDHDGSELFGGLQEKPTLHGPAGHLY